MSAADQRDLARAPRTGAWSWLGDERDRAFVLFLAILASVLFGAGLLVGIGIGALIAG